MTDLTVAQAREMLEHAVGRLWILAIDIGRASLGHHLPVQPDGDDAAVWQALDALIAAAEAKGRAEERARCEPLRTFVNWALAEMVTDAADLDHYDARNKMVALGLVVKDEASEPCGDRCVCEDFPLICYRPGPLLASPTTEEGQR